MLKPTRVDRVLMAIAPRFAVRRFQARAAVEMIERHYEAASLGRRTQGWKRYASDANAALRAGLAPLREASRDLIRNNGYATSALETIVDQTCGWGIVATPKPPTWERWADTTSCDAEGRSDFAGLQKLVMRTVVESGECLVRRRWRRASDGLPLPFQLQVLEPDFLDAAKDGPIPGGELVQGVEFNLFGQRVAYWVYPSHPGALFTGRTTVSTRIPASEILHITRPGRAGQVRTVSWFAPVLLSLHDFDDYEDAALMKQKIAACLAVLTSDVDGTSPALGKQLDTSKPEVDTLEPGMILNVPPGRSVDVVQPPTVSEHDSYSKTVLRKIATGLGVTYEDLTGDYTNLPFSAARMSRLRHWTRVEGWRWRMLIPQFCDPVWRWATEAAAIAGTEMPLTARWTPPPMPLLDPDKEGIALQRLMRIGAITWPEMVRERGYDPETVLKEIADWNAKFDAAKVILDSDPRRTSQQGQAADQTPPPPPDGAAA